jgi:hypothetical protein
MESCSNLRNYGVSQREHLTKYASRNQIYEMHSFVFLKYCNCIISIYIYQYTPHIFSVISSAEPRDSGIYTCAVFQESESRSIISVASLAVKPQTPTISTRETQHTTLNCHSEVLGYIYRDLALKWELNGKLWKDYGLTTLAAVSGIDPHKPVRGILIFLIITF